jgi:predicted metal-dependent phosphoesterase TrpH
VTTPRRNATDLHTHSTRSDGILPPLELYAAMRDYGLSLAAVSDHDTLAGYRELRAAGLGSASSSDGPRLLPAIEINAVGPPWHAEIHILGYGVDPDDAAFERILQRQRELRRVRFEIALGKLREAGMPVDDVIDDVVADVSAGGAAARGTAAHTTDEGSLGRPHLAQALVRKGYARSVDDAFDRIVGRGGPGFVPKQGIGPREAIESVRGAGGLASLAHFPDAPAQPELIDGLVGWGLEALEVYYGGSGHGFEQGRVRALESFVRERGLLATGGSDYHGHPMDDGRPLTYAAAQGLTSVPDEVGDALVAALAARGQRPVAS